MKLENTILSEVTKACESKYCLFSHAQFLHMWTLIVSRGQEVRKGPERENEEAGQESGGTDVNMEAEDWGGRDKPTGVGGDRTER